MKKILALLLLVVTLKAHGQAGNGAIGNVSHSFINGCNLVVSNNSSVTYGISNTLFINPVGQFIYALSNMQTIYTNTANGNITNNVLTAPAIIDVPIFPYDANGGISSNIELVIAVGCTNIFLPANQNGLPNPNNPNNVTNWGTFFATNPPVAATTNQLTFTFVRSIDPLANSYGSPGAQQGYTVASGQTNAVPNTFGNGAGDAYTFSLNLNGLSGGSGLAQCTLVTNIAFPATFLQATRWIRLQNITASAATGSTNIIINVCKVCGYGP